MRLTASESVSIRWLRLKYYLIK